MKATAMSQQKTIRIPRHGEVDNNTTLQVQAGKSLLITAPKGDGTYGNNGIIYDYGTMTVNARLHQEGVGGNAQVDIVNGGKLVLGGPADGGCISLTSGMLEFGSPSAAASFRSGLAFSGVDGTVKFDGISEILIDYRPTLHDILITDFNGGPVADIHVIDGFSPHSGPEFSTFGNQMFYHFIRELR